MLGGDQIGIADHRGFTVADGDFAVVDPGLAGGTGGGEGFELPFDLGQRGFGQRPVRGDQADAGAVVVFSLGEEIGGDHLGIAGRVRDDENL